MATLFEQLEHATADFWYSMGACAHVLERTLEQLEANNAVGAIWERRGEFWSERSKTQAEIENRLGWLDLPDMMRLEVPRLEALALELQSVKIRRALLLGMGGSSLAPEVLRQVLGVAPGYLDLTVLDTTDPAQIARVEAEDDLLATAFIVASKSGTTAEVQALLDYFAARLATRVGDDWPTYMLAITDPTTPLAQYAKERGFRACYLNPSDIGGRFSALSLFGLVPAALNGIDGDRLLGTAKKMALRCRNKETPLQNPGLALGAIMGGCACEGRDKLTLLTSQRLRPFGWWVEQLIAESTGKEGKGILPIEGEPPLPLDAYGNDRLFVYVRYQGDDNATMDELAARLVEKGHPLVLLSLEDLYELGAEFFRWEFATAVAGHLLGINPFDQPNVEAAKQRALEALARYKESGRLVDEDPILTVDGLAAIYGDPMDETSITAYLAKFLRQVRPGGYLAIMAYIDRNAENEARLQEMRRILGERLRVPVTVGFGPRFLHSTGQIHKGGPNTGVFLQITQKDAQDLEIPGQGYTFGVLKASQAIGDMAALREAGRPVVRINLEKDAREGLEALTQWIARGLDAANGANA